MATVIPNRAGEALQRSSENLLNLVMEKRRLQEGRRQFDESLALRADQFDRQMEFAQSGRPHGLIMEIIRNAAPGSTIEQLGIAPESLRQAGLEGVIEPGAILSPETTGSVLNELGVNAIRSGGIPDSTLERALNRVLTGEATTDQIMAIQDLRAETSYNVLSEKFLNLDDRTKQQIFEAEVGLPPSVQFEFGGRTFEFESGQAASTALGFMNLQLAERQMGQQGRDVMLQYREALKTRMEGQGVETFGLGNARARAESERILSGTYNSPESVQAIGDPAVRAFVEAQLASRDLADNSLISRFMGTEEGQAYMALQQLGNQLGEFLPKEEVAEHLESLTNTMTQELGIPIARLDKRGFGRSDRIVLPQGEQAPEIPSDLADDPDAVMAIEAGVPVDFIRAARSSGINNANPEPSVTPSPRGNPSSILLSPHVREDPIANLPSPIQSRIRSLDSEIAEQERRLDQSPDNPSRNVQARLDRIRSRVQTLRDQRETLLERGENLRR